MKKSLSLLLGLWLCLWAGASWSEPVTTIRNAGPSANRLDVVVLGDGYTAADIASGKYAQDVETAITGFLASSPYNEYRNYINVRRIDVASNESGANHDTPTVIRKDTAFNAAYDCQGIQRLICANMTKVQTVLTNSIPSPDARDIVLLLVNDPMYGGSGGAIAIASTNALAIELVLHETGHSFGLLADEYGPPPPPACNNTVEPPEPNVTRQTSRDQIKWRVWIDANVAVPTIDATNGVPGLFEGAKYCDTGLFRPTFASKMRILTAGLPFHQINTEQLVKRIYNFAAPIDAVSPVATTLTIPQGTAQAFTVTTPTPVPNTLAVTWRLNGNIVGTAASYQLGAGIPAGTHVLEVRVNDATPMVRNDPDGVLVATRTWTVTVSPGAGARDLRTDFNNDGNADILFQNTAGQIVSWYLNGNGVVNQAATIYGGPLGSWRIVGTADFNRDGNNDILFQDSTGRLVVWYLNGTGGIAGTATIYAGALFDWKVVATADMNKDGVPDIVFQNSTGRIIVWYMNAAGGIANSAFIYTESLGDWRVVGVADLNGDGNPDLLFQHPQGQLFIWHTNGAGGIIGTASLYNGTLGDFKVVGLLDLNGDGRADVLFQTTSGLLYAWYLNGANGVANNGVFYAGALGEWRAFGR